MLVRLLRSDSIEVAKYFKDLTEDERAGYRPGLFEPYDIFVDFSGLGNYTYHDNEDIRIIGGLSNE